jgi:hypothetical protein
MDYFLKQPLTYYGNILQNQVFMKLLWVLLFYFFYSPSFSQISNNDIFPVDQVKQSIQLYDKFTGDQAAIYNGREYVPYIFRKEGSPFFESDSLTNGYIGYAGRLYDSIPMQYDVARNQVLIENYDGLSKILLHNDAIDSFHFSNHTFIRVKEDPEQNLDSTDFYDLLLNSRIQVLARRKKSFQETFKDNEVVRIFHSEDHFYIHKGNKYYEVNNKKEVLSIFNDKKREIRNLMRQQKIKFKRKNFNEALVKTATMYDQLIN